MSEELKAAQARIACLEGEIAKRDAELAACRVAVENCEVFRARIAELEAKTRTAVGVGSGSGNLFVYGDYESIKAAQKIVIERDQLRAELSALKAQEPVEIGEIGIVINNGSKQFVFDEYSAAYALPVGTHYLYAAPVSEAKAQGVVMPPSPYMPGSQPTDFTDYELGEIHGRIAMWEEVKRLNAAPVQKVSVPDGWKLVPVEPTPKMIDATWYHEIDMSCGIESQGARNKRIYEAMLAAAPAAPAADAWIHVSERLPGEDDQVLCWCEDETVAWADVSSHHNSFFTDMTHELLPVTHWMPLPAAPSANSAKGVV